MGYQEKQQCKMCVAYNLANSMYQDSTYSGDEYRVTQSVLSALHAYVHGQRIRKTPDIDTYLSIHAGIRIVYLNDENNFSLAKPEHASKILMALLIHRISLQSYVHSWHSEESAKALIKAVPELRSEKVLEVGAGTGRLSALLLNEGVDIVATDIQLYQPSYGITVKALDVHSAIHSFTDRSVYIADFPSWDLGEMLLNIIDTHYPKPWTVFINTYKDIFDQTLTKLPCLTKTSFDSKKLKMRQVFYPEGGIVSIIRFTLGCHSEL